MHSKVRTEDGSQCASVWRAVNCSYSKSKPTTGGGKFREAKTALVKAEVSVMKYVKEIAYLIECYTAVQDYYMEEEKNLTAKINDVHSRERSAESQKSAAETRLRCERDELDRHERELSSARDRFREAD